MAKEQVKENAALDAVLSKPAEQPVDHVADEAPAEPTPVAGKVLKAKHTRDFDEIAETNDEGQFTKKVARKYKKYRVTPVGASSLQVFGANGVVVENCLDASEAKQVAYHAAGVGHAPAKYPTKVELA